MSITEKDVQKYEEKYKNILYKSIENIMENMFDTINSNRRIAKNLDLDVDIDLPNIGVTLNNKINEIANEFKDAGISMFATPNNKYDFVSSNFVGDAILDDLYARLGKGSKAYSDYVSNLGETIKRKNERAKALVPTNPIRRFFLKIRSLFAPKSIEETISFLPDEVEKLSADISSYKNMDEEIWNYNLKDNVAQSIITSITSKGYNEETMLYMLAEDVMPTLKSLGLENLESQIKEGINETKNQEKSLSNEPWRLTQSQRIDLQIKAQKFAENLSNDSHSVKNEEQEKEIT